MDARRTPQRIVNAHPPDQRAQVRVDLRPASKGAGFPTPLMAKAGPMPTHEGLRSDDSDGPEHRWKPSIQHDQEQAIPICELDATPHPALQHNQLMTERRVLGLKSALRLERRDGEGQKEQKSAIIAVDVRRFDHAIIRMRLSVHTGISSRAMYVSSGMIPASLIRSLTIPTFS